MGLNNGLGWWPECPYDSRNARYPSLNHCAIAFFILLIYLCIALGECTSATTQTWTVKIAFYIVQNKTHQQQFYGIGGVTYHGRGIRTIFLSFRGPRVLSADSHHVTSITQRKV